VAGGLATQGVGLGPDGAIWFTDANLRQIGRVSGSTATLGSASLTNPPSSNQAITAGSDGNLWIAESGLIAKVNTSGSILAEYSLPAPPQGITEGPDGAVWFTDATNNAIGRITTSGTVTEFTITTPSASPLGITVGPDGNIWFTEANNPGKIGRLTL
jgi:virginiamycin B lyase